MLDYGKLKIIGRFHSVFKLVELIRRLIGLKWRVIGLKCGVKKFWKHWVTRIEQHHFRYCEYFPLQIRIWTRYTGCFIISPAIFKALFVGIPKYSNIKAVTFFAFNRWFGFFKWQVYLKTILPYTLKSPWCCVVSRGIFTKNYWFFSSFFIITGIKQNF